MPNEARDLRARSQGTHKALVSRMGTRGILVVNIWSSILVAFSVIRGPFGKFLIFDKLVSQKQIVLQRITSQNLSLWDHILLVPSVVYICKSLDMREFDLALFNVIFESFSALARTEKKTN